MLLQQVVERLQQAADRQGRRRLGAAAKAERQHRAARQFGDQRDIARPGRAIFPGHRAVAGEILPAVASADIAGARPPDRVALALVDRGERGAKRPLLGHSSGAGRDARPPPRCCRSRWRRDAAPATRKAAISRRRRAGIRSPARRAASPARRAAARNSARAGARSRPPARPAPRAAVDNCATRLTSAQKPSAVGDDKAEVADLRDVDPRIIDFVDDAEAEGEPQPRWTQRAPTMSLALLSRSAQFRVRRGRDPGVRQAGQRSWRGDFSAIGARSNGLTLRAEGTSIALAAPGAVALARPEEGHAMAARTGQQYIEGLRAQEREVWLGGERVARRDHASGPGGRRRARSPRSTTCSTTRNSATR